MPRKIKINKLRKIEIIETRDVARITVPQYLMRIQARRLQRGELIDPAKIMEALSRDVAQSNLKCDDRSENAAKDK